MSALNGLVGVGPYREVSTIRLQTRPNDLDSLGHVNNAVALEFFESGRWDWLARNRLQRAGRITPVVARAEVDYRQEIFAGSVTVVTELTSDPAELTYQAAFRQSISVHEGGAAQVAVEARFVIAFLERAASRVCSLQEFLELNRMGNDHGRLRADGSNP